jgi:hypothetical protein
MQCSCPVTYDVLFSLDMISMYISFLQGGSVDCSWMIGHPGLMMILFFLLVEMCRKVEWLVSPCLFHIQQDKDNPQKLVVN